METETKLEVRRKKNEWEWEPKRYGYSFKAKPSQQKGLKGRSSTIVDGSMIEMCIEPGWRLNDILLAAKVLRKAQPPPVYSDEAEMRRVFGLVYDVFRCNYNFRCNQIFIEIDYEFLLYLYFYLI